VSDRENPSPPVWSCCQARPAKVATFDDGSATIICAGDAWHFPADRISPLPEGYVTPEMHRAAVLESAKAKLTVEEFNLLALFIKAELGV
jgi:hypothetical protein